MDRISQLPESIIHHILFFLNTWNAHPADLVRMSVLSKAWFHLTAYFPILYFNIDDFRFRDSFFKYVDYTTSRFCHQDVTARMLILFATIRKPSELDIVNRCLELLLKNGVRELKIDISNFSESSSVSAKYRLPNILLSVSVLKYLTIRRCELPSSLMLDVVKFKSLIILQLENVHIDDETIEYLTTSCPILKEFHINNCPGFKRFGVHGHHNLKRVLVQYHTRVEIIDIEAPNLCNLFVADLDENRAPQMNLASCRKLTTVTYIGYPLPNSNGFTDFVSNFPFIEDLVLITKFKCNKLKLSSHSLRKLVLHSVCDLEEMEFSTPNLVSFSYTSNPCFLLPIVMYTTYLKGCMLCYPNDAINAIWFKKLRLFLDKKNGYKVLNLYIDAVYSEKFRELEKLKAIQFPPYELEHVELQLQSDLKSLAQIAFVEAVLWCCRPRSLSLKSSFPFEEQMDVVKFTYEKLLEQEDQGHINIQMSCSGEENTISFIKESAEMCICLNDHLDAVDRIQDQANLEDEILLETKVHDQEVDEGLSSDLSGEDDDED